MATRTSHDDDDMITGINVTPLVDIVLVLLVILMVTGSFVAAKTIPMELPQGATAETTPLTLAISIDRDGAMYVDAEPATDDELRARAAAAHALDPDARAVIAADGRVSHAHVVHAIDVLRQ
jgi:biopolymer transport protein ExbD